MSYHAFGGIATALSKNIGVFQASSLKVAPITPNRSIVSLLRGSSVSKTAAREGAGRGGDPAGRSQARRRVGLSI